MTYDLEFNAGTITAGTSTGDEVEAGLVNSFTKAQSALNELDGKVTTNETNIATIDSILQALDREGDLVSRLGESPDNIIERGDFAIDNSASGDLPAGVSISLELTVKHVHGTSQALQILNDKVSGLTYHRSTPDINSPVWSAWEQDVSMFTAMRNFYAYDFVKEGISAGGNPVVIQSTSYQTIAYLHTGPRPAGVYEYSFNVTFTYDSTNRSAKFQFSIDGGTSWEQFYIEPKDVTDRKVITYQFPTERNVTGDIHIILQGACENSGNTLTVDYASIVAERKK